ncbi:IS4 family transposase [Salinibacter ruber]|uniref:IS4 family transposase n=1 Tax=Salinibacter ruber TaxID=146919 RepID=UPI002073880A|nr:IS4 family transposase [Salinibacter ruber]
MWPSWPSAGKPQVETNSTYRRLQRFFAGFAFGYEALGQFLLELVPTDPPYVVVIDRTEWHFGQTAVNVLTVGIAYNGIAFPVAWTALSHGGGSGADEHIEVLERILRVVKPDQIRALVADREPAGSDFLEVLKERKVPFVIRLKSDRRVGPASGEWSLPVRMFARTCGLQQSSLLGGQQVVGGAESVGVRIGLKRLEDGPFLVLASRGVDPDSMFELYRQRWDIETLFGALKSRGFDLEATHLIEPDRIRKLLGVLALTYSWTLTSGLDRKRREGPPRECANGYPEKSLFLLRTGPAPRTVGQLVQDAGRTEPMCSGADRSALIFVV